MSALAYSIPSSRLAPWANHRVPPRVVTVGRSESFRFAAPRTVRWAESERKFYWGCDDQGRSFTSRVHSECTVTEYCNWVTLVD